MERKWKVKRGEGKVKIKEGRGERGGEEKEEGNKRRRERKGEEGEEERWI